jgi:alpha-amylase
MMAKALKESFDSASRGAWIPERVWHPDLALPLYRAGIRYCVLDDTHFIKAGLRKDDTYGYLMTGRKREKIAVFPSDKMLRYTIPFKDPEQTMDYLKRIASKKKRPLIVYADDVEKFGEWPGTYEWVYTKGWLSRFFDQLVRNKDWIRTVKLSEYLRSHRPIATMPIPEASYDEMMEWAGGPWSNFLDKYPEARRMYDKMRYVSDKVDGFVHGAGKKDRDNAYWSKVELYRGQCNCAYWHGVFGGLYMYHLRSAVYNHLIAAENIVDGAARSKDKRWIEVKKSEAKRGGNAGYIVEGNTLSAYLEPKDGGTVKELDYRPVCANIVDTLSRREEAYHKKVRKAEPSLAKKLFYDRYARSCLRDHFLARETGLEEITSGSFKEHGDFARGGYTARVKDEGLVLKRASRVLGVEVELAKEITFKNDVVTVNYTIRNGAKKKIDAFFGTEFNLTMPFLNSERYRYFSNVNILGTLNTRGSEKKPGSFGILDSGNETEVNLDFSRPPKEVWYFPVETISQSQVSYRLNHQCVCIMPLWKLNFDDEGVFRIGIEWCVGNRCR